MLTLEIVRRRWRMTVGRSAARVVWIRSFDPTTGALVLSVAPWTMSDTSQLPQLLRDVRDRLPASIDGAAIRRVTWADAGVTRAIRPDPAQLIETTNRELHRILRRETRAICTMRKLV